MTLDTSKGAARIRHFALLLLLLLPISALGTRWELWSFKLGLMVFAVAVLLGLLVQIINVIWLLLKPTSGTKTALRWASLYALPALVIFALMIQNSASKSTIHNISTDRDNPPEFVAAIKERGENSNPLTYTSEIAEQQQQLFPAIAPLQSSQSPQQAFQQALIISQQLGWNIYAQDSQTGIIEAVDTTLWFGFKDDIVIRIQASDSGSRIDLRSVSRVGKGDLGANAARIQAFIDQFKQ